MENIEIGKRLLHARKDKDLTRIELGKMINLHESTILRYEKGLIKNVSLDILKQFAEALGVETKFLIGWEQKEVKEKTKEVLITELLRALAKDGIIKDINNIPIETLELLVKTIHLMNNGSL